MEIYKSSKDELAKFLVNNPWYYNCARSFLEHDSFLNSKLNTPEAIGKLEEANRIARESDYFVLDAFNSWVENVHGEGSGCIAFQNVKGKLIERLGFRDDFLPDIEEIYNFLKNKEVEKIYTFDPYEEASFGIEPEEVDNEEDVMENSILDPAHKEYLENQGIKVIVLG